MSKKQIELFHMGENYRAYQLYGAKITEQNGIQGVMFTTWAPHATGISVIGDFNDWCYDRNPMMKIHDKGTWQVFIPGVTELARYMYQITSRDGCTLTKADPFATLAEVRPERASIVYEIPSYQRSKKKKKINHDQKALNIYELHFGSWRKNGDEFYSYRELATDLIPYLLKHHFTHIELLPVYEHPYDPSWGYQATGYFAATSRFGTPADFQYFISQCHEVGIGVILDWAPGHFCRDDHGLYMFDGQPTYEYNNETIRENEVWGTANFDLGKPEVQSFLVSTALYWLDCFGIDGFRIDAVANILYWHLDGIYQESQTGPAFLQKLNSIIKTDYPNAIICAEDSTTWEGVTKPVSDGGLGFDYKWKMGWMNDVLNYIKLPTCERKHHHGKMTFAMWYAYSEKFILPLSHDEVVHEKRSLIDKAPGDYWQKFAQLRLLYGFMYAHPGKKLLFMGGEFGQFSEWNDREQLDWHLLDEPMHQGLNEFVKELMGLYKRSKTLWELDHQTDGFTWIDVDNNEQSIFSFIRYAQDGSHLVIICNFTQATYHNYKVGVPAHDRYREILNSDHQRFGGSGQINTGYIKTTADGYHNQPSHVEITIPPFGISILRPVKTVKK